jgi:hypothetical protein
MAEICYKSTVRKIGARDLANRWFQPLTHVSAPSFPRDSAAYGQRGKRRKRNSNRFAAAHRAAQSVRVPFARWIETRSAETCNRLSPKGESRERAHTPQPQSSIW